MENIEHIIQQPTIRRHRMPLLFQHGAWHGAWCWQQWLDYFCSLGYEVHAISLPGHGKSSQNKGHINFYTLNDYVDTLASQVKSISPAPVVVGHSMGGAILQKYLENHRLPGAVLLATLPAIGMLPMTLRLLARHPGPTLRGFLTLNLHHWVGTPELSQELFLNADTKVNKGEFHQQLVSETVLGIRFMFPYAGLNPVITPVLVIAGERDAIFTIAEEQATASKYQADCIVVKGQAHNLMMESAWQHVADIINDWITQKLNLP
jgi:pimeloyl-ACP methyl ester carboxylesterase